MDRYTQMSIFIAVAEEEGFSAGARRLAISPPVVTRSIAELEGRLGVKLLTRTTRHVKVTDAGKRYLEDARRILEELTIAEEAAAGVNAEASGHLTVTASVLFGRMFVLPTVVEYLEKHPKTKVSAVFLDRVVNLLEEGIDVGVRIGQLPDSSMRALRVGEVRMVICASPQYLKKYGLPKKPEDLIKHSIVHATGMTPTPTWQFKQGGIVKLNPRLILNNNDSAIDAIKAGFGIARLISYQVRSELEAGTIKTILSEYEPDPIPVHIVHRENRAGSAKVRSFIDLLAENLRKICQ